MLGSTASDVTTSLVNAAIGLTVGNQQAELQRQQAEAERKRLLAQAELERARGGGAPMISPAVMKGLMIGIPAVGLLVVALVMKKKQGKGRR
jgi:hypothetical protein